MPTSSSGRADGRRVLWVSNETPDRFGQGGQRRQYFQLKALVESGHRLDVMTLAGDQDDTSVRELAEVTRFDPFTSRGRRRPWRSQAVERTASSGRYDAVVVAHIESCHWLRLRSRRPPTLLDIHNVYGDWLRRQGRDHEGDDEDRRVRRSVRRVDAVSVCSDAELRRLPPHDRNIPEIVLPHGIDPGEWRAVRRDVPAEPYVAMFGSWNWPPNLLGLEWLVGEVWPRVRAMVPGAVLKIAGSGTPDLSAAEGIVTVGRVPDLPSFLADAAAVAVPVRTGIGASVKFSEALASGSPTIATVDAASAHPDAPATVSDDPAVWSTWLGTQLQRPATWPDPARRYAVEHLNWETTTKPLDMWLRSLSRR